MPRPRARRPDTEPRPYHHGDLRAALLDSAHAILAEEGLEALTLRAVARRVGVSQTAPYRHFADRRALVAAVAEDGFLGLRAAIQRAMPPAGEGPGFRGVARAYVSFARANPALYRLMFGPEVADTTDLPALRESARGTLGFVQEGFERLQQAGLLRAGDAAQMAVAAWASLHGLSLLVIDGQVATVTHDLDELLATHAAMVMQGLAARAPA